MTRYYLRVSTPGARLLHKCDDGYIMDVEVPEGAALEVRLVETSGGAVVAEMDKFTDGAIYAGLTDLIYCNPETTEGA